MPAPTVPALQTLTDPGWLYWAPLGTAEPPGTVVGGVFTDAWASPWVPLGYTDGGTKLSENRTTANVEVAESFYPVSIRTTGVAGTVTFALASWTATNLGRTMNGAVLTVTGSAATTMTVVDPPALGSEARCMIGWESLDNTVRFVARQVLNAGTIDFINAAKAPAKSTQPWNGNLEKPSSSMPWRVWTAGTGRA